MSDHQEQGDSSRSGLTILGIGCGIMLVIMVVLVMTGFMLKDKVRNFVADKAFSGMEEELKKADLDPDERSDVLQELARLRRGIHANEVSLDEMGALLDASVTSPLMALFLTRKCSKWASENSDLSPAEKVEADQIFDRYLRGRLEGAFTHKDDLELTRSIGEEDPDGTVNINTDEGPPTAAELRALIQAARTKVEAAEIPEGAYLPDISGIIRDLVDPVLK